MGLVLSPDYRPSEDEPFMNERSGVFRRRLINWKEEILRKSKETLQNLARETLSHADLADRASTEAERANELRTRPAAQADLQDRCRAAAHRRGHLWLLRGHGRSDQPAAPRGPSDRDPEP
jgi:hypothetical protein